MKYEPHPKNAPGPFYVERNSCFSCLAPEREAPDLMGYNEGDCRGCYFLKQPSTPEELERAIEALRVSCWGSVRYGGDDPKLIHRLREEGLATVCDILEDLEGLRQVRIPLSRSGRLHPLWDQDLDG